MRTRPSGVKFIRELDCRQEEIEGGFIPEENALDTLIRLPSDILFVIASRDRLPDARCEERFRYSHIFPPRESTTVPLHVEQLPSAFSFKLPWPLLRTRGRSGCEMFYFPWQLFRPPDRGGNFGSPATPLCTSIRHSS